MKLEDKVWLACAIDTDGWLSLKKQNQTQKDKQYTYYLSFIGFHNNNKKIVKKFASLIGSKVYPSRNKKYGTSWTTQRVDRKIVTHILEEVLDYLIVKKEKAEYLLEYNKYRSKNPGNHGTLSTRVNEDKIWWEGYRKLFPRYKNNTLKE